MVLRAALAALLLTLALLVPLPVHAGHRHGIHGYGFWRITCYFATGNATATGTRARWGEVAVDPRVVPLGSWVHIEGIGTFHAEDTGGLVLGRHLDVFVNTWAQAYAVQGSGWRKAYWY